MDWNYVEWAEKAALENLKARLATGDVLHAHATSLLQLLLAGMAGALALGIQVLEPGATAAQWGAAAVAAWLALVAVALVYGCIATRETWVAHNEPKNLYQPELNLTQTQVRAFELENIQIGIDATKKRNRKVAYWLDRCRYAACATPLVFVLGALIGT